MDKARLSAVITGDLIASRKADPAQIKRSMDALQGAAAALKLLCGHDLRFTRYRGDGWQVYLNSPSQALTAALLMHATLRANETAIDSRFAIGIGPVTALGSTSLSDASGPAFEASGTALDTIGKSRLRIAGQGVTPALTAITALCEHIAYGWTAPQAQAIKLWLMAPSATQDDIAAQLGISRQAVQLRLAGAGKSAMVSAIAALKAHPFDAGPTP